MSGVYALSGCFLANARQDLADARLVTHRGGGGLEALRTGNIARAFGHQAQDLVVDPVDIGAHLAQSPAARSGRWLRRLCDDWHGRKNDEDMPQAKAGASMISAMMPRPIRSHLVGGQ